MKNKIISSITILAIALMLLTGCGKKQIYNPGTYEGSGKGHGGDIKVEVTVSGSEIESVKIVENPESEFSQPVIKKIIDKVVKENSGEIDSISGATETSSGLIAAIQGALSLAYADGKAGSAKGSSDSDREELKDTTVDVVVIGSGGAALAAAVEAQASGANVLVLEKMAVVGGNTNYATGGLNAAGTEFQKAKGISDTIEVFFEDTMKGGKNLNNPDLVKILVTSAAGSVEWLTSLGADLSDVGRLGGATNNRTHRPTGGGAVGAHLVSVLKDNAEKSSIEIRTENKVVEILADNGAVKGVKVETASGNYNVFAKAVIIASGGFGASQEMVVKFKADLKGFGTTNHPGATGDAIKLVEPLDVALVDMEQIQTHPTVIPVKNKMITEAVRGNGAILVNRSGERFINELQTRDVVSAAELEQEGKTGFLFFDQNVRDSLKAIEKYAKAGFLTQADSIADLAKAMGLDPKSLEASVEKYNSYAKAGKDPEFGRVDFPVVFNKAPYYMVEVGPAVHHTMGGIKINTNAEVIGNSGNVVKGLYAAGEVTGGVHGANRLGGNALSDIITFGRLAGKNATAYVK